MPQHKELSHNHVVSVQVPNGEWKLSVYSAVSRRASGDMGLLAVLAFLLSVLGSLFAYRFALRPKKLLINFLWNKFINLFIKKIKMFT